MIPIVEPALAVNDMFSSDLSPAPLYVRSTFSNTTSAPFAFLSAELLLKSFPKAIVFFISLFVSDLSSPLFALSVSFKLMFSSSSETKSSVIDGFISNTVCILFPQLTSAITFPCVRTPPSTLIAPTYKSTTSATFKKIYVTGFVSADIFPTRSCRFVSI